MNVNIKLVMLSAIILLSAICTGEMTEKKWEWIKTDMTEYQSAMQTLPVNFTIGVPQETGSYYNHTCVYAACANGIGRWQRIEQIWNAKKQIGKLVGKWDIRQADGSEAFAGIACEAVDANGEQKVLKVEAKQFKEFPDWVFYHYSGCVPDYMSFGCIALRPQTHTKYQRSIWLEWEGGKAECGDENVPWFEFNHALIDGFAAYSRGGEKEPEECSMVVWIPEQYGQISVQSFKKNHDRYTFYFYNTAGEYTFALGQRTTGSGEKECAPKFISEERAKIAEKLRHIDWTLKADVPLVKKKYDEIEKQVENTPASKELSQILADIDSGDAIRVLNAEHRLDNLRNSLVSEKLNDLFD